MKETGLVEEESLPVDIVDVACCWKVETVMTVVQGHLLGKPVEEEACYKSTVGSERRMEAGLHEEEVDELTAAA